MTIHTSTDGGVQWKLAAVVDEGPGAYSSLAALSSTSVGIAYEADWYGTIRFAAFTVG
jgi:hypothetical protein